MGQETGLTAISLIATLYFIGSAKGENDRSAMVMAGLSAALGFLSREYGGAFIVCGVIACLWKRCSRTSVLTFVAASLLPTVPWYIRNWVVAGNPFYSNPVGHLFALNSVHTGILTSYIAQFGFRANASKLLPQLLQIGLLMFPIQLLLGIGGVLRERRRFVPLAFSCLVVVLLWVYSVGRTSGGLLYSCRVLSPVLALLSVAGAVFLAESRRGKMRSLLQALVTSQCVLGLCQSTVSGRLRFSPARAWRASARAWVSSSA